MTEKVSFKLGASYAGPRYLHQLVRSCFVSPNTPLFKFLSFSNNLTSFTIREPVLLSQESVGHHLER